ncbi:MAG: glycosyltransferase [Methylococcales bacterium]|nr:glycosyltransferase [Methylococcales bacterium]MBT7445692.1 glycosyltransferase [Methylococcales bacterium]
MKILILGRLDGWMGVHMQQYANGFRQLNHDVELIDYHIYCQKKFRLKSLFGGKKEAQINERTFQFKLVLNDIKPDVIIFTGANLKFNFSELRENTNAKLVYVDMDGPASSYFKSDLSWINALDLVATVSMASQRVLNAEGYDQVVYLPHGVDTTYYQPLSLNASQLQKFTSPIAFVGKPSGRRERYLEPLIDKGLTVWGGRWSNGKHPKFESCVKDKKNIIGADLNDLYNATDIVLNILQRDAFSEQNTILSLQVFAIPASGSCLITEWVEELDAAFDVGEEVLTYRSADELYEHVETLQSNPSRIKALASNSRARCVSDHTHAQRSKTLLHYFE